MYNARPDPFMYSRLHSECHSFSINNIFSSRLCGSFTTFSRSLLPSCIEKRPTRWRLQVVWLFYSRLFLECPSLIWVLKSQSLISFSRSLLPGLIEERPTRLRLLIEIEWHSECGWVMSHMWMSHVTYDISSSSCGYCLFKTQSYVICLIHVWHDSFTCVTWLIHVCDITHSHVWHYSFTCETWLIHMCDIDNIHTRDDIVDWDWMTLRMQ